MTARAATTGAGIAVPAADRDLVRVYVWQLPVRLTHWLIVGLGATRGWLMVQQFLHRTPFGITDPVFGRDLGYYVFTVPVLAGITGLVTAIVV